MAEGYPIDAQKALWKQYNEVLQLLLSEFKGGKYNDIKEFRKAVFWDLLQNHGAEYQTHADVLTTTVFSSIEQRRFNVLNLDTVVEYLNQSFEAWKFFKPNPRKVSYTPIHTSASNINSFVKKTLIPFVKVLNGTVDANIEIPSDFGIDGISEQQEAVNKLYKDLRKFAKDNPNIKLADVKNKYFSNQVKFKQNPDLQGANYAALFSELRDEFHDFELQAMFSVVPGTEGIRPALNVATSVYESIDDVWETLDDGTKTDLAELFDLLELDPNTSTVQKVNYAPEDYKLFIKDKITEFLTQFSNNANQYLEGTEGFVEANPVFDATYSGRGGGIRRAFREVFKGEFLETNRYPIDVLLNKSPDPIGLLQAIDDAHKAMNVNVYNPPYVGEPVINKIQEIAGLKTDGVQSVGGFLGMKFAGMTVPEVAAEVFDFPQRPDAVDIKPMMDRLNVADTVLVEKNGTVTGTFTEVSDTTPIPLGEDITIYHSRPESQGPLATDVNFHAGTYQAALDRASFKYAGKSINEMLYETLTELNAQINTELANIEMGEDYSTTISAEIGIGDNIATIEANINWDSYNEELTIHLSDDQDYFQRYPEYAESFAADDYGYSATSTMDQVAGELDISDYVDPDSLTRELPFGTGADFAWADGYKLYEITIPKDAKVLNLDKPITVKQKGQTVNLTGDRLQEAIEKGINQPNSDSVYQGIESISIGNKKVDIPEGLNKTEITELLFGEYDVIAYKNDIEDVGSFSYIVKPKYASAVRELTGDKRRLFNNRVLREYVGGNPSLFKGSVFDMKRKLNSLLGQITDPARKNDANIILQYYRKLVSGDTGIENSPEYSALTRLMSGTYDDTPTNVVDDIKLTGTMGGNTTPTGTNIAYANVKDLEQFIQFDRKAEGNAEKINEIKKTISSKGYLYDTAYDSGVVFGVTVDELGNVQIAEGNHRLQALIDFARETGQEIYVPVNPVLASTGAGNKVQLTNTDNAYNSMKQLLTDMLEGNKNFNVESTINEKLGEPGSRIIGLNSYTYPGGASGTSTNQNNIKKFFNSIGLNTITYDELPDNNIYKTGVNTFIDTPTNVVDDLETEIARTDGIDALNKSKDIINKNPRIFGKILNVLEKLDVGDQVIQQVIKRALPRIGLGAVAGPIGIAYAVYETSLLLADAASAAYKSETTDEGFWENFGEISDKYSIAYKITKPTYELLLDAVKADLEDNNTLYSFSR